MNESFTSSDEVNDSFTASARPQIEPSEPGRTNRGRPDRATPAQLEHADPAPPRPTPRPRPPPPRPGGGGARQPQPSRPSASAAAPSSAVPPAAPAPAAPA